MEHQQDKKFGKLKLNTPPVISSSSESKSSPREGDEHIEEIIGEIIDEYFGDYFEVTKIVPIKVKKPVIHPSRMRFHRKVPLQTIIDTQLSHWAYYMKLHHPSFEGGRYVVHRQDFVEPTNTTHCDQCKKPFKAGQIWVECIKLGVELRFGAFHITGSCCLKHGEHMALELPHRDEVHVFMTLPKPDKEDELYVRRIAIIHAKGAKHVVCHHHEFQLPLPMDRTIVAEVSKY